jgi:hypothetical protein
VITPSDFYILIFVFDSPTVDHSIKGMRRIGLGNSDRVWRRRSGGDEQSRETRNGQYSALAFSVRGIAGSSPGGRKSFADFVTELLLTSAARVRKVSVHRHVDLHIVM